MSCLNRWVAVLSEKIRRLTCRTGDARPDTNEVDAMVNTGDIVVLREQRQRRHADGWGSRCYSCETDKCRRLP